MSTTPSTSELPYTVVGRQGPLAPGSRVGLSAILLNRGGRPVRAETFIPFAECGLDEVIVVLGPHPHYEIEQLVARVPRARFILLSRDVTVGEQINIGIREARTPHVLTIWTDMRPPSINPWIVEKVEELDAACIVPLLKNERNETIPTLQAPAFYRSLFRTVPAQPGFEGALSLYAYADTAVFDARRFERLGGFDPSISNPYWQRLDLGMRTFLWGERIRVLPSLRIQVTRPLPADDTTPDASYARFHLKNLGIRFVRDQGRLPSRQLLLLILRSGLGIAESVRLYRDVRAWVEEHHYRFTQDARRLTELWETAE